MGKKTRYSDADKATALAALDANGGNVARTARQTKVPRTTLIEWANGRVVGDVTDIRQQKKGDLAARLDRIAWKLARAIPKKIDKASLAQTATAMGIAIDKARLLRGEATEISEQREDSRTAEFRRRYAAVHPGTNGAGQPVHPPSSNGAADPVPRT